MWIVYQQAKEWGQRPSDLLFIKDPYVAYCFNEAVYAFGSFVEGELNKIKRGKKQSPEAHAKQRAGRLRLLLQDPIPSASPPPQKGFRTPVAGAKKSGKEFRKEGGE